MDRFLTGVLLFAISLASSAWHSFIAMKLWGWFAVPAFAVPHLTFWMTWGILLTLYAFRGYNLSPADFRAMEKAQEDGINIGNHFMRVWIVFVLGCFTLLTGWILTFLI